MSHSQQLGEVIVSSAVLLTAWIPVARLLFLRKANDRIYFTQLLY